MKSLDETKLQVGDIVLSTQDHYVSKAIRAATKSDISHAMLYVARGSVIDSTGEGVQARNSQRIFFDVDCAVHVRRLYKTASEEQRQLVISYARGQIGTRYSKSEAVRSTVATTRIPSRQQFCSRLVAQAYAWAGIKLVESPDYCTPDEIKNSPLLAAVPDAVIPVSDEHVDRVESDFDTNVVMREVTNKVLDAVRIANPKIECFDDIDGHLIVNPEDDGRIAQIYEESGYLLAWRVEFDKNRWQYELPRFAAMPQSKEEKRAYCMGVLDDHGDMLRRRDGNRAGYTILYAEHGLRTFSLLKGLYEELVDLQVARRAVALQWLQHFVPEAVPGPENTALLIPHTEEWFAVLDRQNPQQASFVRIVLAASGSIDVCTFCGDSPAPNYRLTETMAQRDTVFTAKLCADCRQIRNAQYDETFELL